MLITVDVNTATSDLFVKAVQRGGDGYLNDLLDEFLKDDVKRLAYHVETTQVAKFSKSGKLGKAIEGRVVRVQGVPSASVGVFKGEALEYAGAQEYGGEIKSSRTQPAALAMPLVPEAKNVRAKDFPGLKYVKIKPKPGSAVVGMLVRSRGRTGRLNLGQANAVYLLLSRINLKPKGYLRKGAISYVPILVGRLEAFLRSKLGA